MFFHDSEATEISDTVRARSKLKAFLKVAHLDAQYREITLQWGSNANWLKIRHFHFYKKPFELVGVLIVLFAQNVFFHFFKFSPIFFHYIYLGG